MDDEHPLFKRLMDFDMTALGELEKLSTQDPSLVLDIGWRFITQIDGDTQHVPAGLVDGCLIVLQNALGRDRIENALVDAWSKLGDETRGEICYSGISNPRCLSNAFCERLFDATDSGPIRIEIIGSLYSTLEERNFPVSRWIKMVDHLEVDDQRTCQKLIDDVRQRFPNCLASNS